MNETGCVKSLQVPSKVVAQGDLLNRLIEVVVDLRGKLSTVIPQVLPQQAEVPPSASLGSPEEILVPLAFDIEQNNCILMSVTENIRETISWIEV